jgi:hypothetical protein
MQAQKGERSNTPQPDFRVNVRVRDMLMQEPKHKPLLSSTISLLLPEPIFPQRPELCGEIELDGSEVHC